MPDRRPRAAALLPLVAAMLLLVAVPATSSASPGRDRPVDTVTIADVPPTVGEDCVDDPDLHPGTGLRECPKGFDLVTVLPFVAGGVVVLFALAVGWFLVMRRRASRPFLADEATGAGAGAGGSGAAVASSEWWTCKSCGSTNMVGSARCYKCGSWQR